MQSRRNASQNQPALVPIAGNFDRKPRSLDRDVTTVGRARGTDLCLEANEISTLHCIIYRTPEGFRIRDCNSRCGTRINGESIKAELLHDCDIINLGPFSFEFRLPHALFPGDGARPDPAKIQHLKESRRRLAERAIALRKRLRGASPREQEWAQKAHLLKDKIRSYDQRLGELEAAEQELTDERQQLAKEAETQRQRVQVIERQLADQLAQVDQETHQRWQEFQKRCQAEEQHITNSSAGRLVVTEPADDRERRERVRDLEDQYNRRHEQLQREQQEFTTMKEQWVRDQNQASTTLEQQQAGLAQKKTELVRMMGELKKMQDNLRKQAKPDVRALQEEIDRLHQENTEMRGHFEGAANGTELQAILDENEQLRTHVLQLEQRALLSGEAAIAPLLDDLRAEVDLLREELENKEKILCDLSKHGGGGDAPAMRAENELLKKLLEERDRSAEELRQEPARPKTENDLDRYETELNSARRQLETDRTKLNREVEMLRDRNQELDDAIREMEMQMSKERAELGRERIRLERVRAEVKADTERLQRELAVRDSMAPVQKLRDELLQKQASPATKTDKPSNDRLRPVRNLDV